MNKRQKKKMRKKNHQTAIENVALEISLASNWRKRLFSHPCETKFEISYQKPEDIPPYIRTIIIRFRLEFYVSKVSSCCEKFDSGFEVFKFESKEFPKITRFSGNNPNVI